METTASDLSARLLATENLSVVRARTRTASFDIISRVLTLPLWKDMTPEIEDMLIGHEVAHALYTTEEYLKPIHENSKLQSYLNVLEDVRIEKLIKRKYPGLRKRMNEGYRQLNERDFFGLKQLQSLEKLLLIDKINLYYKAGYDCGVKFNVIEKSFVDRAEHTETIEDVVQLANEIYEYSKQQVEERKKRQQEAMTAEDKEDQKQQELDEQEQEAQDLEESDEDDDQQHYTASEGDDSSEDRNEDVENDLMPSSDTEDSEELESKTEKAFAKQLEDLADTETIYKYYQFDTGYMGDTIIGYKRILNETHDKWAGVKDSRLHHSYDGSKDDIKAVATYEKFKTDSIRAVNYLVKEFEMKKSASILKRAQTSKIGSLDMKKVWSYKLNDDLFKRVTTLPQGKNHGMIFLLDWSGSMSDVIHDTLQQVINLAMFCQRTQIKYQVLAFTTQYEDSNTTIAAMRRNSMRSVPSGEKLIDNCRSLRMFELFSSNMSTTDFHSMGRRVLDHRFFWNKGYDLGSTPLNESLVWVYQNLGSFIKDNSIEKMTLITLSDGEGSALNPYRGRFDENQVVYEPSYKRVKQKNYIRDDITKKTYELNTVSAMQTSTIVSMIRDRYKVKIVGFYVTKNSKRYMTSVIASNLPLFKGSTDDLIEDWRREFRDKGFASIKNTGRDEFFLIPQESTKIDEGELVATSDMTAKSIAKNFSKFLNVKRTSRVLLSRFIEIIA